MNPETLSTFVTDNIPPELVTIAIVLGGLSGTFFFIWGVISPAIKWFRDTTFQLSFREIEVHIADPDYYKFNLWLNSNREHTYFQRAFKVVNSYGTLEEYENGPDEDQTDSMKSSLVPGFGSVLIKAPGMPYVWVMRTKEEAKQTFKQTETLRFRVFSIRQSAVDTFFETITSIRADTGPQIYTSSGNREYWSGVGVPKHVLPPLGASSVELVADVENFLNSRDEYLRRGIPYKRGYMLSGPPGTGKSSDVAYLSHRFGMNVYQLGSGSISKFDALRTGVRRGSIVLIEDIDMTVAGMGRKALIGDKKSSSGNAESDLESAAVHQVTAETMREFLNALDGICEFDGSIIIITTNKPQALDAALLRPGRIDKTIEVGPYTPAEQIAHLNRFYDTDLSVNDYPDLPPITVAELQYVCTTNMNSVDDTLKQL